MKDQKDFYNFIRQEYKKKTDVKEVPEFMKVYYEIENASKRKEKREINIMRIQRNINTEKEQNKAAKN